MRPLEVTRRRGLLGRVRKGPRENNPRPRNVGFSQNILFVKGEQNCTLISGPGDGKSRKIGSRQGNRVYNCPCLDLEMGIASIFMRPHSLLTIVFTLLMTASVVAQQHPASPSMTRPIRVKIDFQN